MRVGVFADSHDHIDNVRRAVAEFNRRSCALVIFAGDFVSPLVCPALRKLACPILACFGDNDGNRTGILSGMRILGGVAESPVGIRISDGTIFLVTHTLNDLRGMIDKANVVVFAHTHRPSITRDERGRMFVNPGETSGWTFRKPSIAIVETCPLDAEIVSLPDMPLPEIDD